MGTHLVTNAEFATFLNDALSHPDDERGAYLYFDSTTGGVYINSQEQGQIGVGLGARTVKMFSPSLTGQIVFAKGTYRAATSPTDFSHHPIAGVSWYGALKYCNWLTIDQGMLPSERCYAEATDADISAWHPVSISTANWAARELTDAEREILTRDYRGYRLPMDDGAFNTTPAGDAPDAYNEWYLAAAWNPMLNPPRDTLYGFGRDALTVVDANFRGSGDAFDNGSTPVDYYVAANGNAFGIQDMTGNVYQWMQDRFSTHPGNLGFRALRGGSWNDPIEAASLRVASRSFTRPERVDGQIGFRVGRTLPEPTGDLDLDGDIDSADLAEFSLGLTGPAGRVFPAWSAFDFDADGDVDLMDLAEFQRIFTGEF